MEQPVPTILERLEEQHSFPGPFMFKAIGPNTKAFVEQVTAAVVRILGDDAQPQVTTKESSGGRHVAATLRVQVRLAQQVVDVWALMAKVPDVKMVM